ncbi:MAG: sensor histidine kinase [Phycisphaerae bacterium]|nr:sensor histidine kinase [Phycisphaerae bacterium]
MAPEDAKGFEKIGFKMHPRVFAALGADLVTNDVVAVIELVKNSYDAFASNVWIRFKTHAKYGDYLEIEDDGLGMTRDIIRDVWCLVATPYREQNPFTYSGRKRRRVAGEKGLGRLSVARLGDRLHMVTQVPGEPCWEVRVNWNDIASGDDLGSCFANCRKYPDESPFKTSGTRLRIFGLRGKWDESRIGDLEDNMARLISPFAHVADFNISLSPLGAEPIQEVRIESPDFLGKPKYSIAGKVDEKGNIKATYKYTPIREGKPRTKELTYSWEQIYDTIQDRTRFPFSDKDIHSGPFSFEIRAWDIASEDTQEIADRFDFQKSKVRKAIRAHKGISVYRDGILVLPKSENARDWLGLDLRRVSKVGTRLSTSQVVGYVAISAEDNPDIGDTSDREHLAAGLAVAEFEELLKAIVALLENERDVDRLKADREKPLEDLFGQLSADKLVSDVTDLADEGADASDAVPVVRSYGAKLDAARKTIQERFVYYSRLATVGTIAQMLVHEIRNRTTAFGGFMTFIRGRFAPFKDKELAEEYKAAEESVHSLERLADTFAPLASRGFRRRNRHSVLEARIEACLSLEKGEIARKEIECRLPKGETHVAVDPGELDAILLNLITNAVFWLGQIQDRKRKMEFHIMRCAGGSRVRVWLHDNGPGLQEEDREKVLWAGFTRKPGGIGMGLTVASELVAEYGGKMTIGDGVLGGASFGFDVPVRKG